MSQINNQPIINNQGLTLEQQKLAMNNPSTYATTTDQNLMNEQNKETKHGIGAMIHKVTDKLHHHKKDDHDMTHDAHGNTMGTTTYSTTGPILTHGLTTDAHYTHVQGNVNLPAGQTTLLPGQTTVLPGQTLHGQTTLLPGQTGLPAGQQWHQVGPTVASSTTEVKSTPIYTAQTKVIPEHQVNVQSTQVIPEKRIDIEKVQVIPEKHIPVTETKIIPEQRIPITETKIIPEKIIPVTEMKTVPEQRVHVTLQKDIQEVTTTTTAQKAEVRTNLPVSQTEKEMLLSNPATRTQVTGTAEQKLETSTLVGQTSISQTGSNNMNRPL